jgi:hypothetical protein
MVVDIIRQYVIAQRDAILAAIALALLLYASGVWALEIQLVASTLS